MVVVVAASIFVWGLVSARLQRADLTAPIVFTLIGAVVALTGIAIPEASERLKPLVEITLVWVLFADAARIRIPDLRNGLGLYVRLLAIGLTVGAVEAFTARTAEAAETVQTSVERQTALEEAASKPPESSWLEWVPIIGDLWSGELNSGESSWLAARDEGVKREKFPPTSSPPR